MTGRYRALGVAALALAAMGPAPSRADPPAGGYGAALGQVGGGGCAQAGGHLGAAVGQVVGASQPAPSGGYGAALAQVGGGGCSAPPGKFGAAVGGVGSGGRGANPGVCPPGSPKDCQAKHNVTAPSGGGSGNR